MEQLLCTDHKKQNKKAVNAKEILSAFLVSLATAACFLDLFSLWGTASKAGSVGGGLIQIWNQVAQVLCNSDYVQLQQRTGASEGCGLFLGFCVVLLSLAIFLLIKSRKKWTLFLPVLPICFLNICFHLHLQTWTVVLLVAAIFLAMACMESDSQGVGGHLILAFVLAGILFALMQLPLVSDLTTKPQKIKEISSNVQEQVKNWYYGENPLGSGDLTKSDRPDGEGTAMEVTMSNPQSMYLRGFVGEKYTGNSWKALSGSTYDAEKNTLYWLQKDGFHTIGQLGQAAALSGNAGKENQIRISVKKADKRLAYIPYEIKENTVSGGYAWGGSYVSSGKFGRLSDYTYTAGENAVKSWTKIAAQIFTTARQGSKNKKELEQYFVDESYFNTQVYQNDTYLSDIDKELLSEYIGASGDQSKGHIDYKQAIEKIRTYLKDNFVYTKHPGDQTNATGALEQFLSSGEGYDAQYATTAVMMFRYYGIPARYVEGYLITPEDVKNAGGQKTIAVPMKRAHAWAEIYIDGVGFVPIEVCPEYEGIMEEADMKIGISNNSLLRPFDMKGQQGQKGQQDADQESPNAGHRVRSIWISLVLILGGILLLLLLIFWIRKLIQRLTAFYQRHKLFYKAKPKIAVSGIYASMEQAGYPLTKEAYDLGNKAAYSPEEIGEQEREVMLQYYKQSKKKWREQNRNVKAHKKGGNHES